MKELLVVACFVSVTRGLSCSGVRPPVWPKAYSARGKISVPEANVDEPFTAFYDEAAGKSRIDYWSGTVQTYQIKAKPFGYMRKVDPSTKVTCSSMNGTASAPVTPQTVLPDLAKYKCADVNEINGIQTQKWVYVEVNYMRTTKFTMWITADVKGDDEIPFPVRFEIKNYDAVLGSINDHYFILYDLFSSEPPGAHVWKVESGLSCSAFDNTEMRYNSHFNPVQEYVLNKDDYVDDAWEYHKRKFNKKYAGIEHLMRRQYFKQNRRYVFSVNRSGCGFKLKLNQFADWSQQELGRLRGRKFSVGNNGSVFSEDLPVEDVPKYLDWRLAGLVTKVKDQGMCGTGWAFSATGVLEGVNFVSTGSLVDLSEQALVDCTWNYGNDGCDGGDDFRAFRWAVTNGGCPSTSDYGSYMADERSCHADRMTVRGSIKRYVEVPSDDSTALRAALFLNGPVSVALHSSIKSFIFYSTGVYSDPDCRSSHEDLDHYALLVGYGELNGKSYWLVKNSWSSSWGNDGYILIAADNNVCGIMTSATYVQT